MNFIHRFLRILLSLIVRLRYRIIYDKGALDTIEGGGLIFCPNHPAEVDPLIIYDLLGKKFQPRPLVVDYFYHMRGGHFFMKATRSIPVPNFDTSSSKWKMKQVDQVIEEVKKGLAKGDNFLIYPSGHLQRHDKDAVGGSSLVHTLISECPESRIVLIHIRGLWGSIFSRALTGFVPPFWKTLLKGIRIILKNGIFFVPKRRVEIDIKVPKEDLPRGKSRLEFNQYLDAFYREKEDPLTLISHAFYKEDLPQVTRQDRKEKKEGNLSVPNEMRQIVFQQLTEISGQSHFNDEMDLSADLGLDSLDIANLHAFLDERYDIGEVPPGELNTVFDLFEVALGKRGSRGDPSLAPTGKWPHELHRPAVQPPKGALVQEAFFNICKRMGSHACCADQNTGVMSYKRMKLAVLIMSKKIEKMPGDYIGILLPSSVGTYLTLMAILVARKLPVMLNWTAGVRSLNYAQKLLGLKVVLSSRKFIDKVEGLDLGLLEDKLLFLEDVKEGITFKDKLRALFSRSPSYDDLNENDPALLLFTSGTETYPKAVPLSHRNLLQNQMAALSAVDLHSSDIIYGVLPPFHSFGSSVTGLLPLLAGLRVFFSPDPTDNQAMARDISHWKVTIVALAPSFMKNLFRVATAEELNSVRLFVVGAEKAPQELFQTADHLGKPMIEGYGITECSPMVSLVYPGDERKGVGKPLPGVELCTIDPETLRPIQGEGEICIRGPSVFGGYMSPTAKNPFVEIRGKRWYRSGDIGHIDKEGNLILGGRIKRFVKIGGEMISLGALEDELCERARLENWYPVNEERPSLAMIATEGDKPQLILFATFPLSKEKVNNALKNSGFARIVKVSEVRQIKEVPLTGTGKVHFRKLEEMYAQTV
ncbi:MAG: AMP-binding protein [Simkaniaceae bacterium]|nr:AMP-binding protein [Simkaniaceae bacterium]